MADSSANMVDSFVVLVLVGGRYLAIVYAARMVLGHSCPAAGEGVLQEAAR